MRLYTGKDTAKRNKENYLQFASRFLDVNQLTNYVQTAEDELAVPGADSTAVTKVSAKSAHAGRI